MEREVTFTRRVYLGATAEEVWPWLVEPEKSWQYHLSPLRDRPLAPGDPVQYVSKLGGQVLAEGTVEEIVEGRRLVHTFQFQFDPEEPEPVTRVTFDLIRYGDRMCCLELRHEGLDPEGETCKSVTISWDVILSSLKTLVETGRPLPWPSRRS
jgi:uncharacterized protein YndB with AHSA1/START domain